MSLLLYDALYPPNFSVCQANLNTMRVGATLSKDVLHYATRQLAGTLVFLEDNIHG